MGAALCLSPALLSAPLLAPLGTATAAPAAARAEEDPLEVTLQSLTPSEIPRRGPIEMSGVIVNNSDQTWTDLKVYPWRSRSPITTVPDLELAAETDPALGVGTRIITTYDVIDQVPPGGSATYHLTVPRGLLDLTDESGVYWIGVQVLATSPDGRDDFTDGRARTFIPLMPRRSPPTVQAALVVPIRHPVVYARDGSLRDVAAWLAALQPGGQLRNVIQFLDRAPDREVTVVLDPAVVEAIQRLARGNPPRDLGPADTGGEPSESPSGATSAGGAVPLGRSAVDPTIADNAAQWADEWLTIFDRVAAHADLKALPYGDPDVDAASALDPGLITAAVERTRTALKALGLTASPIVAPPSGYLSATGISGLPTDVRVLLSNQVVVQRGPDPSKEPSELTVGGHLVRLADTAASSGGPAPGNRLSTLQVRQRLLAEAALRALSHRTKPLVMAMPSDWNPGVPDGEGLFQATAQDWLDLVPEAVAGSDPVAPIEPESLAYPPRLTEHELTQQNFDAADELIKTGTTLQNVLTHPTDIGSEVLAQALTTVAYAARDDRDQAAADATAATRSIEHIYEGIRVQAPPYVTLSSANGRFRVDLTNDLDQAVTVRLEAFTDSALVIQAPNRIKLKGHSSTTVLLSAESRKLGVHQVTLLVTDVDGTPLGPSDSLPIRANEVGRVIWVIMAGGATLLFGAIGVRLYRRFRRHPTARRPLPSGEES
jgi:hypothetical protein